MSTNIVEVAKYLSKANAPYSFKISILQTVDRFMRGEVSEKILKLYLASLLKFCYDPNWWIERHILRMLGVKVEYPPIRFCKPVMVERELSEEAMQLLKDTGIT